MRISHKLKKCTDGQTYKSIKRHLGLPLLTRRLVFRVDPERLIATIDLARFETVRQRYAIENPGEGWQKFLDLSRWMAVNWNRVRELELDFGFRKRILDLGCGTGYFLYICDWLGHDVVGLDVDDRPMYGEVMQALGLGRVLWRIRSFQPLPDLGRKFDLITAFLVCFNGHKGSKLWGPAEWKFFLDDLETRLRPGGRMYLELNRELHGAFYTEDLRRLFGERGAAINRNCITFGPALRRH